MQRGNNLGLTIVEIILAMSFTVVIILILFAALRLGYRAQDTGDNRAEDSQRLRIITDRLHWIIRGAYPYRISKGGRTILFFKGSPDSLGLVTTSTDTRGKGPEDLAGLKWVSIHTGREGLKMTEKVFFDEDALEDSGGKAYIIDPDVKKLDFEYFDLPEGKETAGEWVPDWDGEEKSYLPSAVRLKITYTKNGREADMPEVVVAIHARGR